MLPGVEGELGIYPRHTPLFTQIKPGAVRIKMPGEAEEEIVFVQGGFLEVQPDRVTVLADTAIRANDLDEAKALEAKRAAEEAMPTRRRRKTSPPPQAELAGAMAQLAGDPQAAQPRADGRRTGAPPARCQRPLFHPSRRRASGPRRKREQLRLHHPSTRAVPSAMPAVVDERKCMPPHTRAFCTSAITSAACAMTAAERRRGRGRLDHERLGKSVSPPSRIDATTSAAVTAQCAHGYSWCSGVSSSGAQRRRAAVRRCRPCRRCGSP